MNKRTRTIKSITEGGVFAAIYALLAIISRYLLTSTDSLIYYFTPLIIAIYIIRNKTTYSIAVTIASIVLSFLFASPFVALMVIMPNIIIGFIFGLLEKHSKIKLVNYLVTFILCLIVSILSIIAFEKINGIKYFDDVELILHNLTVNFPSINNNLLNTIFRISIFAIILIDAAIKTVLLYLVIAIIIIRLKLVDNYSVKVKLPLKFSYIITLVYILILILFVIFFRLYITKESNLLLIIVTVLTTILFLFSYYLAYQVVLFVRFKLKTIKNIYIILISLLILILLPISLIIGLILNLINYNILLDMI